MTEEQTYAEIKNYERNGISRMSRNAWKRRRRQIKASLPTPIQKADIVIEGCGATLRISDAMMAAPRDAEAKDKAWRRKLRKTFKKRD